MLIKLNLQRFAPPIGVQLNITLDSGIESIHMTTPNEINTTITSNGIYGSLNMVITTFVVTLKNGYIMDKMLVGTSEVTATSENTYEYTFIADEIAVSFTSKKATSQVSIDLTTLSGWGNVADGQHSIQIVAKADGYKDSEKSTAVSFTKGVTGHTLTITNSSSSADILLVFASTSGSFGGDLLATIAKGSTSEVNIPTDYVYFACSTATEVFFTLSNVNPSNALVMDGGGMDYLACKINQNGSCTIKIG